MLDIGDSYIHEMLDESKNRQFNAAWDAYILEHPHVIDKQIMQDVQKSETRAGNYGSAINAAEEILNMPK